MLFVFELFKSLPILKYSVICYSKVRWRKIYLVTKTRYLNQGQFVWSEKQIKTRRNALKQSIFYYLITNLYIEKQAAF